MKETVHYEFDFLFVGEHPAALWGASLALEAGFKVMLIKLGGIPSKSFLPRFAAAQLGLDSKQSSTPSDDPIQILTPDRRFRVGPGLEDWNREHLFCFGRPLDPVMGPRADIMRGLAYLYRGEESAPSVMRSWSEVAHRVSETQFLLRSTADHQVEWLERLSKKGAKVVAADQVAQIFVEKKRLVGVQLLGHTQVHSVDQGVISAPLPLLTPYLNVDGRQSLMKLQSRPLGWKFTIDVKISPDAIPTGIGTRMIYVEKDAPIVDIHHRIQEQKPGVFSLKVVLPFDETSLSRVHQRKIAQRLVRLMSELIPDFSYNVQSVVPDIRDPEMTEKTELSALYPFQTLDEVPWGLRVYGHPGLGLRTPIEGLALASDESDPSQGDWGAYQAVQSAFQSWLKRADKLEQSHRQPLLDSVAQSVKF
jgi:hypothetical protein